MPRRLCLAGDYGQLLLHDGIEKGALPSIGLPHYGYIAWTITLVSTVRPHHSKAFPQRSKPIVKSGLPSNSVVGCHMKAFPR